MSYQPYPYLIYVNVILFLGALVLKGVAILLTTATREAGPLAARLATVLAAPGRPRSLHRRDATDGRWPLLVRDGGDASSRGHLRGTARPNSPDNAPFTSPIGEKLPHSGTPP